MLFTIVTSAGGGAGIRGAISFVMVTHPVLIGINVSQASIRRHCKAQVILNRILEMEVSQKFPAIESFAGSQNV
jgi:hypothetical protein